MTTASGDVRKAIIRTSDRSAFKRCRRKWAWHSQLRHNLRIKDTPSYFWLGTGGHFALEDYYGYNHYGHPTAAFDAYVEACKRQQKAQGFGLPDDWQEQTALAKGILEYYFVWLEGREEHQTVWIDGEPQVEIRGEITLDVEPPPGFDVVVYQFTIDRLVEIDDEYWITDYKFFKNFTQSDLTMDAQLSAYIWAAATIYDKPIAGAILHEFKKTLPKEPRILANGKLSTAANQGTTHRLYRKALIKMYGSVDKAPAENIRCLNEIAHMEGEDRDNFIRRTKTRRTPIQIASEGTKILMEATDMCNPDLPLYPNPTKDCSWDCALQDICLMIDRDDDWDTTLKELTQCDEEEFDSWRHHLVLDGPNKQ